MPSTPQTDRADRTERALGAVIGSAVGDALGAPFEFGPEGAFSARFPYPGHGGEMCGGGGWDPGEATDDTQMAVLVAESLLECGGLELPDVFRRFRRWAAADPKDIGLQTEAVLSSGDPWDLAAALHFQTNQRAAGNGALMRAAPPRSTSPPGDKRPRWTPPAASPPSPTATERHGRAPRSSTN